MATIKDLANRYGLEDYEQLLGGYPNATKFVNALQSNIESHIPTTEDLQSPERMGEWSLAAALNQPTGLAIKGYHGSPHKFKEFDTAHMGTGEGGQAYGWGNYITEDPYVATTYSPQDDWMDEQLMNLYNQAERRQDYPSMEVYERYMMHERPNEVKEYLNESYADYPEDLPKRLPAQKIGENLYKKQKGSHLYEVSMEFPKEREAVDPMSIEHFLDYDKPLSEQSDYVKNILQSHDPDIYHPEGLDYDPTEKGSSILNRFGSGKEGAQKLYELGIPGTTYMGEKSKVANPEGVRNFVTYSDEVPRVVTRNMNKVKPLTDEDRLNDLEKQMSAYMKTKRMPKGVDFKSGSDWYDWAYDKRAKLRGYAKGGIVDKLKSQDFGPNDSVIISSLMHPQEAAGKAGDWLQEKMRIASGRPYEDNFTPDQQAQAGLDLAGLMQTGAMPFAPASAGGTLGTFIGPKSRNWDKVAAELAAKKLDEGADPAEVWREHLIGRMPDKTLFSEIPDTELKIRSTNFTDPHGSWGVNQEMPTRSLEYAKQLESEGENPRLIHRMTGFAKSPEGEWIGKAHDEPKQKLVEHQPLANEYDLSNINFKGTDLLPSNIGGSYQAGIQPRIILNSATDNNNLLGISRTRSNAAHELQHAIQQKEGWGQGGSPQEFTRQKEAEHARDVLNWRNEVLARKKKYPDTDTNAIENNIIKDYIDMGLFNDFVPSREARELATQPYMMYPERYDHTNEFEKLNNLVGEYGLDKRTTPYTPIEGYKRLTGEAQARATQDRLDMDMAQRRENYPLAGGKLSDIPLEELIYKYAEGGSVDKDSLQLNKPQRTPNHPTKSHIVKTMVDGKEKIIRFGEQGAETAGKPKEGESDRMTAKRESFKARHAKNIAKGPSSAAYWADKVKWAEGGSVSMEDLPFNDPDQLRLYHQAMKHYDDVIENTGGSKKMGKTEARINYNTTTKGDRDRDKDLHTLIADYGIDVGKDAKINATMIKPMEAEGVYLGNLSGSVPVGEGRASLGLQGLHTKYSDGLSGYTAGYNGKVGGGDLSASYFEPADHNSAGRQVQLEYSMPFADGGSVSEFEDPTHERLYRRAMAHFDDMSAKQNFEDNDSMIASTILHPVEAAKRAGSAFMRSVDTAGGRPKQALDESSWYPVGITPSRDEQAQAALDLAGIAQTGAMPFAPESAGGVLGSILRPNSQLGTIGSKREKKPITELEEGVKLGKRISTATPTEIAAKKMNYHSTPEHIITLDTMRSNPEAFEKNMKLMSEYMPFNETDTNKQADLYRKYIGDNLRYFVKNAPEDFTQRSGNWYKGANALANDISNAYNIPIEASAGVLARLSPQQNWLHNVEQADRVADIFTNHQNTVMPVGKYKGVKLKDLPDSLSQAEWIKDFDQHTTRNEYYGITPEGALSDEIIRTKTGEPSTFVWQSFPNLSRAVDILKDPSIENVSKSLGLGGHKIRNFYNNMADPFHPEDVTIDTHAGAAALFTPYSASAIPIGHLFGGGAKKGIVEGSSKSGMAHGMYGLYADSYRDVAKDLNLPAQSLQSQIWELVRETFPTMGKEKMQKQIQTNVLDELKKGKITEEEARNKILDIATKGKGFLLPDWYTQDYAKGGSVGLQELANKYM